MRVVDASVAVKWFLAEQGSDKALRLLEQRERLIAPSIIRLEVAGAISRQFRLGHLSQSAAEAACDAWRTFLRRDLIELVPITHLFDDALRLSFACRHALADCLYLATAQQLEAELLTADQKLVERATSVAAKAAILAEVTLDE